MSDFEDFEEETSLDDESFGDDLSSDSSSKWWDKPLSLIKLHPIIASMAAAGLIFTGVGTSVMLTSGQEQQEQEFARPQVQEQGDNGSKVVTGGGKKNQEVMQNSLPTPDPAPVHIPEKEVKPQDIEAPAVKIDQKRLDQSNHKGQESVPNFVPGAGADKVDTKPRPAASKPAAAEKSQDNKPVVDKKMANTIQLGTQRIPMVPSGDNGKDSFVPPENPALVGWYQNSAEPGTNEPGSVVVSSHIDYNGQDGVGKLFAASQPGDVIVTWNTQGVETKWKVTKVYNANKTGGMADAVNRMDGKQSLVMVTCGGAYVGAPLYYQDNIVVEAEMI